MGSDIQTSIHGSRIGLSANNDIVVQNPKTGLPSIVVPGPLSVTKGVAYVVLTAAQVLALNTTPISIVPALGGTLAAIPTRAIVRTDAGTAYTVGAASDLTFRYTNAAGQQALSQIETTGFLDQATTQIRTAVAIGSTGTTAGDVTPVANAPVVASIASANVTGGTSPLYVKVFYDIIDTAFTS